MLRVRGALLMPKNAKRSSAAAVSPPGHPPSLQVGALCWRRTKSGVLKILLITSRETRRWVIPKGWPMRKRSEAEAAAREAFEEAGVRGTISERSIGLFYYAKVLPKGQIRACTVRVFSLEVQALLKQYPETGQRKIRWFTARKAAGKVVEPDLAALIREFGEAHARST